MSYMSIAAMAARTVKTQAAGREATEAPVVGALMGVGAVEGDVLGS